MVKKKFKVTEADKMKANLSLAFCAGENRAMWEMIAATPVGTVIEIDVPDKK
jgi:hypothetical protein